MRSAAESYVESLTPWPEEFGLGRMHELLRRLGDPQLDYPSIHVVGSNGKSTTVRMAAALLRAEGLSVGAYTSPHVTGWPERIQVDGEVSDFGVAIERVRAPAEALGATQFEVLTAAALAEFAARAADVAVVEAGLGGRLDATNVLRSPVQVLTNVSLEHTGVLGSTRQAIAAEKLAVAQPHSTVVLGEPEWEGLARANGARAVVVVEQRNVALATTAAEAFLGRHVDSAFAEEVHLPGRLERRGEEPLEVWDGAHNPGALAYVVPRLPSRDFVVVCSVLSDKDVEAMLAALATAGSSFVATSSANPRALPAGDLAARAARFFESVEAADDPLEALDRARQLAGPAGAVFVTGSLYLLSDLTQRGKDVRWARLASG
ncbi:MAG: bifunctional folylpolyglutamate synthase/dihydrofolate synthase [Actinobacteria bacterium]|nr:bifunctional folylpolyglutamate synthase/dihydrofolate synthase [Actinomycetota bacterium]